MFALFGVRATSSFGVQSHYIIHFGVQSHYSSSLQHSEPLLIFVWHSEPWFASFDVQTHVFIRHSKPLHHPFWRSELLLILVSVFRAITGFLFGVQSHILSSSIRVLMSIFRFDPSPFSSILAFKAIGHTLSSLFRSFLFLILAFRAIVLIHSGTLSHHFLSSFLRSKSRSLAFIFTGIAHLTFIILHPSSLTSPCYPVLITYSSLLVQIPVPLHMTQSLEFTTHTSIVLLRTLHLSFSCSSDRVVFFGRRLFYALGRFDRHSSLICFFLVTFGDVLEGAWVLSVASGHFETSFSFRVRAFCSPIGLREFVFH